MDDILNAAGVSAGGAYRYFASKDEIIAAVAGQAVTGMTAAIDEVAAQRPAPSLDEALHRLILIADGLADGPGRLALMAWGEAQTDPAIAALAQTELMHLRDALAGLVGPATSTHPPAILEPMGVPAGEIGAVLYSLVAGYLIQRRILGSTDPDAYGEAIRALLTSGSPR